MSAGSHPHVIRQVTVGADEVPENMPPDIGTYAGQIHAHPAIATVRRGDRQWDWCRVGIHLAGNGHDGCLGEWNNTTRAGKFNNWELKGAKAKKPVIPGRCAASNPESRDSQVRNCAP